MAERENSLFDNLINSAGAAKAVKGAVKTGKTVSGAAKGAALGGPYGAANDTLGKQKADRQNSCFNGFGIVYSDFVYHIAPGFDFR